MSRYRLSLDSLIRQRKLRIIKDPRESLMLDEIIRLRDELDKVKTKPSRKKKETTDDSGDAASE